jgi:hypothetical protein
MFWAWVSKDDAEKEAMMAAFDASIPAATGQRQLWLRECRPSKSDTPSTPSSTASPSITNEDLLAADGDDLRKLPLAMRKTNLARLLARRPDGIFVSDFGQGEIGPELFRKACEFGLEGLVSKHRDRGPAHRRIG